MLDVFQVCLLQMITDGLEWCVDYCDVLSDLILTVPIHCRASIAETLMQRHISPDLMMKNSLDVLRANTFSADVYF